MGIFGHHDLEPVAERIAIFDQFVSQAPQTIVLKEKVLSVSGDSFDIKFDNGQPLLKVKGAWVSLSGRKKVEDASGKHLFDIVKELMHIHTTYALEDTHGKKVCEVKNNLSRKSQIRLIIGTFWSTDKRLTMILAVVGSKATATFTDHNDRQITLKMKGGWYDHSADIVNEKTGQTVARIDRKLLSGRDFVFDQQTYAVIVAPGVDAALVAALCICFDEKNNEE